MPVLRERGEGWFTALYSAHYPQVVRYALRRIGDPDAAAEVAQEVFVVAWRRRVEVPDRQLPWLYGVARRLLANHWRARQATPVQVGDERLLVTADEHSATDRLADVRRALVTLSDADQELLRLVGWEELSLAEAAAVVGCSRAAAAVRLHRARGRLSRALSAPTAATPRVPAPKHLKTTADRNRHV
ncbi:RNA polymerase sigma factor [Dactylosporangium sp. CA-233914]|uniref:RNA polymerase sigma factor n=1 Tax=Dactylosporangium sp. CA-233914 TaxID=3239934 RepID=UPI003D8C935C